MILGPPGTEGTSRRQASLEGVQGARQGLPGRLGLGWGGGGSCSSKAAASPS